MVYNHYMKDHPASRTSPGAHPALIRLLLSLAAVCLTLLGMEAVFYVLGEAREQSEGVSISTSRNLYQRDELLAASPRPNIEVLVEKKRGEEVVYAVTYATDAYSRRITPMDNPDDRTRFVLFFGGSFTFGEGVEQNETLPFYVSELSPDYKAYNYGFLGYGPQQMLAKLQSDDFASQIDESNGILIYTFLDHHVNRAVGTARIYRFAFGGDYLNYVLQEDGTLVLDGTFTTGRPVASRLYRLFGKSRIVRYFKLDFPPITEKHIQTTAKIIEEARDAFIQKFPDGKFYVLFFPNRSNQYGPRLAPYLQTAGIEILDYANAIPEYDEMWIPGDGHPTPQTYRLIAEMLVNDLELANTLAD